MSGRIGSVTNLLLTAAALLTLTGSVSAHALMAAFRVLPEQKVRVEAWFETDEPASGAKVEVFRSDNSILVKGKMDDDGVFTFSFTEREPLRVVVNAGMGHGKELTISAEALSKPSTEAGPLHESKPPQNPDDNRPIPHDSPPFPLRDLILGITFLLAVAAFILSIRNAQALKQRPTPPGLTS